MGISYRSSEAVREYIISRDVRSCRKRGFPLWRRRREEIINIVRGCTEHGRFENAGGECDESTTQAAHGNLSKKQRNREKQRATAESKGESLISRWVITCWMQGLVGVGQPTPRLMSTWAGPWRVVMAEQVHVYSYEMQNIVPGAANGFRVARLRLYADETLHATDVPARFHTGQHRDCYHCGYLGGRARRWL